MLLHDADARAAGRSAKEKGPRRGPFRLAAMLQKPVQVGATPPSVLGGSPMSPMPSKLVLITLDSPSVQFRPNPAFPKMLPPGVVAKSPDPKTSRMPSPPVTVPGMGPGMAVLFRIVVEAIWADDFNERARPKAALLLITTSRRVSDEPLNAKMPPCETELPFPVMVLTVLKPKFVSPKLAEPLMMLTPAPVFPEIVFPPAKSAVALVTLTPTLRTAGSALVPLPITWFIAMRAVEPNETLIPLEALALMTLPPALLKLSTPMRAEPPLNAPIPNRAFWLICELITVPCAASIATPSRALPVTVAPSTMPLAPCA